MNVQDTRTQEQKDNLRQAVYGGWLMRIVEAKRGYDTPIQISEKEKSKRRAKNKIAKSSRKANRH